MNNTLIYGYGNIGRTDDGLGIYAANTISKQENIKATVKTSYQLNIEDAYEISGYKKVVFIDATDDIDMPYYFKSLKPSHSVTFTSHELFPPSILNLSAELFESRPEAHMLSISGYEWDVCEGLSIRARKNLDSALEFLYWFLNKNSNDKKCYLFDVKRSLMEEKSNVKL